MNVNIRGVVDAITALVVAGRPADSAALADHGVDLGQPCADDLNSGPDDRGATDWERTDGSDRQSRSPGTPQA